MTDNTFDLAKAKAGHPVQTDSGSPARIVCFDAKGPEPLVVLISEDDADSPYFGFEMAWQFREDGGFGINRHSMLRLVMKPTDHNQNRG